MKLKVLIFYSLYIQITTYKQKTNYKKMEDFGQYLNNAGDDGFKVAQPVVQTVDPTLATTLQPTVDPTAQTVTRQVPDTTQNVYIKTMSGTVEKFPLTSGMTVADLKKLYNAKSNINIEQMRFVYNGKQPEDHELLEDYGIGNEDVINCVLRLKGGVRTCTFIINA